MKLGDGSRCGSKINALKLSVKNNIFEDLYSKKIFCRLFEVLFIIIQYHSQSVVILVHLRNNISKFSVHRCLQIVTKMYHYLEILLKILCGSVILIFLNYK